MFSHDILAKLGSSHTSPMWLRTVALTAVRADKHGVADFDLMELRSRLRWKDGYEPALLRRAESAVGRARSAGLLASSVALARMYLPSGIRPALGELQPAGS